MLWAPEHSLRYLFPCRLIIRVSVFKESAGIWCLSCYFGKLGSSLTSELGGEVEVAYRYLVQLVLLWVEFKRVGRHFAVWLADVMLSTVWQKRCDWYELRSRKGVVRRKRKRSGGREILSGMEENTSIEPAAHYLHLWVVKVGALCCCNRLHLQAIERKSGDIKSRWISPWWGYYQLKVRLQMDHPTNEHWALWEDITLIFFQCLHWIAQARKCLPVPVPVSASSKPITPQNGTIPIMCFSLSK